MRCSGTTHAFSWKTAQVSLLDMTSTEATTTLHCCPFRSFWVGPRQQMNSSRPLNRVRSSDHQILHGIESCTGVLSPRVLPWCCSVNMCESVGLGNDNAQYQKQCYQDEDDDDQIPYFFQFSSFKGKVIGECAARERQTLNGYGIRAMVRQTAQIWHPILAEQRPHPARAQSLPSGRCVHATARERYQHSKFCEKRWTAARWKPLWALREASPDARPPYAPPL